MSQTITQQALAFASALQALRLVQGIARNGFADRDEENVCLSTLFKFDAAPNDVLPDASKLRPGLQCALELLKSRQRAPEHRELIRYLISCLYLQASLKRRPEMATIVRNRLEHAARQQDVNDCEQHDCVEIAPAIAAIYVDTISTLNFRLQIGGSQQHLENTRNANRIRALLMAAIRSLFLWRQAGGSRFRLIFGRNALMAEIERLLASVDRRSNAERTV